MVCGLNGAVVYAVINNNATAQGVMDLLAFHVSDYRAAVDICCSVSEEIPQEPTKNETWNMGEVAWFHGWFTILCEKRAID